MAQEKEDSGMAETNPGPATSAPSDAPGPDEPAFEAPKPQKSSTSESKGPEGGYDDTPIPRREVRSTQ